MKGSKPSSTQQRNLSVKQKFDRAWAVCSESVINAATFWSLSVDYQYGISKTSLKEEMVEGQLNLDILIKVSRYVHKMSSHGIEMQSGMNESCEVALAIYDERKWFEWKKTRHHDEKNCSENDSNNNLNNNKVAPICWVCGRNNHGKTSFW